MTKVRDRYQSGFDETIPGVRSAVYDIGLALYLLERFAEEHGLLDSEVTLKSGKRYGWSVAELLQIARRALNTSITPAMAIYERLQQNEEATDVLRQVLEGENWQDAHEALSLTLNNKAIISRGLLTRCRREIERRAKKEQGGAA